jgi:hypothetical protein
MKRMHGWMNTNWIVAALHHAFFFLHSFSGAIGKMNNGHHLILGELRDYLTGETLKDTHDERYRQKLARLLVEQKGFAKTDIVPRFPLTIRAGGKAAVVTVDFVIQLSDRFVMLVMYGPGSIVTRHKPALALSRLIAPYQVPVVVASNGEDADIIDGFSGETQGSGLDAMPSKADLQFRREAVEQRSISGELAEMAARIVYAYEVDDRCPCDDDVCRID